VTERACSRGVVEEAVGWASPQTEWPDEKGRGPALKRARVTVSPQKAPAAVEEVVLWRERTPAAVRELRPEPLSERSRLLAERSWRREKRDGEGELAWSRARQRQPAGMQVPVEGPRGTAREPVWGEVGARGRGLDPLSGSTERRERSRGSLAARAQRRPAGGQEGSRGQAQQEGYRARVGGAANAGAGS
jgi:hypothetical protein